MTRPDLYKSSANRKANLRHRGDLSERRQPGEPLVPASVMRLMRAFAGVCIAMLVCGPGALALTCDELKAEIARLQQTLANEQSALANCNNHPGSCTPGQISGIQQAIQIAGQEIAADQAQLPTACAPPPPPNVDHVSLQGVEVVQAVQDMSGSVPLIAGKTTWVRVYLDKNNGTRPLTASLKAQRGTTTLSLNPVAPITVDATENLTLRRQNFSKSLNFAVPAAMIGSGTTIFTLATPTDMSPQHKTIICDNCGNPAQVSFSNMPPLVVRLIGLTYQFQPTPGTPQQTATPRPIDFTLLRSWLARAYPVSQVISSQTTAPVNFKPNFDGTTKTDCTNADAQLSAIRAVDMAQPGADNRTHYLGLVSNQGGFIRGCSSSIPAAPDPTSTASGPSGAPGGPGIVPVNATGDADATFADWYSGHELAHTFGRNHPGFCNNNTKDDLAFPYPAGQIGTGVDSGVAGLDVGDAANGIALTVLWPTSSFEIMTYCNQPQWLSDYTYNAVRQRLLDENPGFMTLSRSHRAPVFVQLTGPLVHVVASVNLTKRTGSIDYVTPLPSAVPTVGLSGRSELVLRDAAGREISRQPVPLKLVSDTQPGEDQLALVDAAVPFHEDMAEIDLVLDGTVIAQYTNAQGAPPAVSGLKTTQPRGASGPTIGWSPAPTSAGKVTYTVQQSGDGGQWLTIAVGLADPRITLSPDQLKARQLRFTASNGYRSSLPIVINVCPDQITQVATLEAQVEDFQDALASGEIPPPPRTPQRIAQARAQLAKLVRSLAAAETWLAQCQAPGAPAR
jgi:hypothetical protein